MHGSLPFELQLLYSLPLIMKSEAENVWKPPGCLIWINNLHDQSIVQIYHLMHKEAYFPQPTISNDNMISKGCC